MPNRILQLLNKRHLEKLKEDWWNAAEYKSKCEKIEDQSDGISIQNIGGVFIVIFVGIGMACITLIFEYWWYKIRKTPKIIDVAEANVGVGKTENTTKSNNLLEGRFMKESGGKTNVLRPRNSKLAGTLRSRF